VADSVAKQAAFLDGGMEIISKPFAIEQLGHRIGDILQRRSV
jgi:DNA-binding response OmpR family regulator